MTVRRRLADQQAALLAALVAGGPLPGDFDPAAAAATSEALIHKRAAAVAKAEPALARALGPEFHARFARYAASRPLPRRGGARADARAFAKTVDRRGEAGQGP
jgi:hypothetical protein